MSGRDPGPDPGGLAGIVLAGGRSDRFGSDKLSVEVDGEPLLWKPIRVLVEARCREVVVVIGPTAAVPVLPPELGQALRVARDPEPFGGPLVGLRAGLAATRASTALVVAGDQPGLPPELLGILAEAVGPAVDDGPIEAAVLVDPASVVRPLPCALDREHALRSADRLLATGERSLRALVDALRSRAIPEATWRALDPLAGWTRDVDRPEDLPPGD